MQSMLPVASVKTCVRGKAASVSESSAVALQGFCEYLVDTLESKICELGKSKSWSRTHHTVTNQAICAAGLAPQTRCLRMVAKSSRKSAKTGAKAKVKTTIKKKAK